MEKKKEKQQLDKDRDYPFIELTEGPISFYSKYNNAKVAGRFIGENNFRTLCVCEIEDVIQPNAVWEHDEESTAFEKIREMELRVESIDSKLKHKASKTLEDIPYE